MNTTKTKQKSVKKGALNLKVKIIDWTPINKAISDKVGMQVECRLGKGFIEDVEAVFNKEFFTAMAVALGGDVQIQIRQIGNKMENNGYNNK